MMKRIMSLVLITTSVLLVQVHFVHAELQDEIAAIKAIDHEATNYQAAQPALIKLQQRGTTALLPILGAMDDANPLASNYLRNAFEVIANNAFTQNQDLPLEDLLNFVRRTKNRDISRRLAFEWVRKVDPKQAEAMVPLFLNDPSSELRREAVARLLMQADDIKSEDPAVLDQKKGIYLQALSGATDDDQVKKIVNGLKPFDVKIDLQQHYGFLATWNLIGPFNNKDEAGFNVIYPPEFEVDLSAEYDGQLGKVSWKEYQTDDDYGVLDIATQLAPHKGAIVYAYQEFETDQAQPVEFRLSTPNAWKLWVNGKLLFEREEYHRGTFFDQYQIPAELQSGKNTILLKVLQNEQDQSWAQKWQIQFRVCQPNGMALLPAAGGK